MVFFVLFSLNIGGVLLVMSTVINRNILKIHPEFFFLFKKTLYKTAGGNHLEDSASFV